MVLWFPLNKNGCQDTKLMERMLLKLIFSRIEHAGSQMTGLGRRMMLDDWITG